jgi:hypothetical protein
MTAKKTASKAVTKKEEQLPAVPFDFEADAGAGMEGTDSDSFAIPFLRILQKLSPQCDETNAEFVEGAKAGMMFNSVTGKLYDGKEGVHFLPCAFQRRFIQWAPRGAEGGFKGEFMPEDIAAMRAEGKIVELDGRLFVADDSGNVSEKKSDKVVDTRSHFGLVVDADGDAAMALLPLSSTQIKKSKRLMSILNEAKVKGANGLVTPPTWMSKVKLTTVLESNDEGSWYGVRFEADGFIDSKDLYEAGKAFHDAVSKGERGADFTESESDVPKNDNF